MKLKTTFLIFISIFLFSFAGFAQDPDEDPEFGNGTRATADGNYLIIDFETITEDVVQKEITIKNNRPVPITIGGFSIPGGIGIVLQDKVIEGSSVGHFIVFVYTKYIEEKEFERYLVVETRYKKPIGETVVSEKSVGCVEMLTPIIIKYFL